MRKIILQTKGNDFPARKGKKKTMAEKKRKITLTLEEIEEQMVELTKCQETSKIFLATQKFDMLKKLADMKIKMMEVQANKETKAEVKPITVNVVSSVNEKTRIEKLDQVARDLRGSKEDA